LLSGKERAQYPDMAYGARTFKHAKKEDGVQQQKGLLRPTSGLADGEQCVEVGI